jgi:hypothetical protein
MISFESLIIQKYRAKKNNGNLIKETAFEKEILLKKIKLAGLIIK